MKINWNEEKNQLLKKTRNVSFEQVEEEILNNRVLKDFKHPNQEKYKNQSIIIVEINGYICQVPAVKNQDELFLKTIFKSRKYNKKYKK
jgi:uncharacterized DUF497 family protein